MRRAPAAMINALTISLPSDDGIVTAHNPMKSNVCLNWANVSFRVGLSLSVRKRHAKAIPPVGRLISDISSITLNTGSLQNTHRLVCQLDIHHGEGPSLPRNTLR